MSSKEGRTSTSDNGDPPGQALGVLIADGERLFAAAVAAALALHSGLVVIDEHPSTGTDVLKACLAHRPELLLLDMWIPGPTSFAVTRMLSVWSPSIEVLMTTASPAGPQGTEALRAGAIGWISKSGKVEVLVDSILHLRQGAYRPHREVITAQRQRLRAENRASEERWACLERLSPREVEVLQQLSQGLPSREVAENLSISAGTVKHHITKILGKTHSRTQVEAVNLARREGLVREFGPPYAPPEPGDDAP